MSHSPPGLPDHPAIYVPPPLIYVAFFLAGAALQRIVPLPALPAVTRALAVPLAVLCVVFLAWSVRLFKAARTSLITVRPASTIVAEGPFRFTRNPMYLSLLLLYLSVACWLRAGWPILLAPFLMWVMTRFVIGREERYLERKFGARYLEYRGRVRRWL